MIGVWDVTQTGRFTHIWTRNLIMGFSEIFPKDFLEALMWTNIFGEKRRLGRSGTYLPKFRRGA